MKSNKLYQFKINPQNRKGSSQDELRKGIIDLLEVAPIQFKLDDASGNEEKYERSFPKQVFTFETQDKARQFALPILKTKCIFFCELKEVNVE